MTAKGICIKNDCEPIIVTINELPWSIEVAERGSERLKIDGNECLAVTIYPELKIVTDKSLEPTLMRQTLIHELAHAVIFSYGHTVTYDEECVCNFIGSHLDEINRLTDTIFPQLVTVLKR